MYLYIFFGGLLLDQPFASREEQVVHKLVEHELVEKVLVETELVEHELEEEPLKPSNLIWFPKVPLFVGGPSNQTWLLRVSVLILLIGTFSLWKEETLPLFTWSCSLSILLKAPGKVILSGCRLDRFPTLASLPKVFGLMGRCRLAKMGPGRRVSLCTQGKSPNFILKK